MSNKFPFLSLDNVTLKLNDEKVFPNSQWTVYNNEHWAIVGPNSSGKSTLMRAVCGKVPVLEGGISYGFLHNESDNPTDHIAYVSFDAANDIRENSLYYQARWNTGVGEPGITVSETLTLSSIHQRNPYEIVESVQIVSQFQDLRDRIIDQLNIGSLLTREVHQLSNGERRKLSIARALMRQPKLLILDEIFDGLDLGYRKLLERLLNSLLQTSMRVFLVTSDPEKIPSSIDKILVIYDHKIVSQGSRKNILSQITRVSVSRMNTTTHPTNLLQQRHDEEPKTLIRMRDVTIAYNETYILRGVNWEVREGERWALLGSNGAGKTTLLSLILGDNPQAYANDIELFGRRRGTGESIWDIKRRIGWMAPELQRHYPPLLNCIDVVCSGWFDSVGLYQKCNKNQLDAGLAVMADLKIDALTKHQFRKISETEQRLVLLARALVKQPQLLILDEPCQGLDTKNRQIVYRILDNSSAWAESLILVTHQTHHLPKTISHVLMLKEGRSAFHRV